MANFAADLIESRKADIAAARADIKRMRKHARRLNKLGAYLSSQGRYAYVSLSEDTVCGTVSLYDLSGFKDERLIALLAGIETVFGVTFDSSTDWTNGTWPNRDFAADNNGYAIRVCAYVRTDSPTCRKVQTGVERVETPVYKIVCE